MFSDPGSGRPSMLIARPARAPLERQVPDGPDRDHAGHAPTSRVSPSQNCGLLGRSVVQLRLRQRHLHHQHVPRIEPGIDAEQPRHAHQHHAGAGEDDQRQRDFGGDEPVAQPALAVTGRARAPFSFSGFARLLRNAANAGARPNRMPLHDRDRRREGQHADVDARDVSRGGSRQRARCSRAGSAGARSCPSRRSAGRRRRRRAARARRSPSAAAARSARGRRRASRGSPARAIATPPRASIRFATLTQAISSTKPTTASIGTSGERFRCMPNSLIGSSRTVWAGVVWRVRRRRARGRSCPSRCAPARSRRPASAGRWR